MLSTVIPCGVMAAKRFRPAASFVSLVRGRVGPKRQVMKFQYILSGSFSTDRKDEEDIPEDFFDPKVELEKEFLDVVSALEENGGLSNITNIQKPIEWKSIEEAVENPLTFKDFHEDIANVPEDMSKSFVDDIQSFESTEIPQVEMVKDALIDKDLAEHLEGFQSNYVPPAMLNYNVPWQKSDAIDHEADPEKYPFETLQDNFLPETDTKRYMHDAQGLRSCPGKRQKKGKKVEAKLECHLIDLEDLNYIDVIGLRRWLSDDAEILPRKVTGLCAKCQRKVAKAIKRSRNFGLLPHLGEFVLQDGNVVTNENNFHASVATSGQYYDTKIV